MIHKGIGSNDVYDFGGGNGFPGMVMAILAPKTKFYLVDVDQRRCEFLKHAIVQLGLKNVEVLTRPVESIGDDVVKCGVARGFASIPKALLMTRKVFALGGVFYHLKGEEWATEIADIPTQLCAFWSPGFLGEYKLPIGEVKFAVVHTEKIKK